MMINSISVSLHCLCPKKKAVDQNIPKLTPENVVMSADGVIISMDSGVVTPVMCFVANNPGSAPGLAPTQVPNTSTQQKKLGEEYGMFAFEKLSEEDQQRGMYFKLGCEEWRDKIGHNYAELQRGKIRAKFEAQMKVDVDTEFAKLATASSKTTSVTKFNVSAKLSFEVYPVLYKLYSCQAHHQYLTYQGEQQTLKVFMMYLRGNYQTDQIVLAIGHAGFGGNMKGTATSLAVGLPVDGLAGIGSNCPHLDHSMLEPRRSRSQLRNTKSSTLPTTFSHIDSTTAKNVVRLHTGIWFADMNPQVSPSWSIPVDATHTLPTPSKSPIPTMYHPPFPSITLLGLLKAAQLVDSTLSQVITVPLRDSPLPEPAPLLEPATVFNTQVASNPLDSMLHQDWILSPELAWAAFGFVDNSQLVKCLPSIGKIKLLDLSVTLGMNGLHFHASLPNWWMDAISYNMIQLSSLWFRDTKEFLTSSGSHLNTQNNATPTTQPVPFSTTSSVKNQIHLLRFCFSVFAPKPLSIPFLSRIINK
ncbi:hypothetical protein HDU79_011933, partial [Rhizoclosmatium sp. JEL0117]